MWTQWWKGCKAENHVKQLDVQLGRALTKFASKCVKASGKRPPPPPRGRGGRGGRGGLRKRCAEPPLPRIPPRRLTHAGRACCSPVCVWKRGDVTEGKRLDLGSPGGGVTLGQTFNRELTPLRVKKEVPFLGINSHGDDPSHHQAWRGGCQGHNGPVGHGGFEAEDGAPSGATVSGG